MDFTVFTGNVTWIDGKLTKLTITECKKVPILQVLKGKKRAILLKMTKLGLRCMQKLLVAKVARTWKDSLHIKIFPKDK